MPKRRGRKRSGVFCPDGRYAQNRKDWKSLQHAKKKGILTALWLTFLLLGLVAAAGCGPEIQFANGDRFTGETVNDRPGNQGKVRYADGSGASWELKGRQAVITFANGNRYTGEFQGVRPHGQGTMAYANGDRYTGQWKNGLRDGMGVYSDQAGTGRYTGTWKNDRWNGAGARITRYGSYYGQCKDNRYHGQGTIVWANGNQFTGRFVQGRKDGQGVFRWTNGESYAGAFQQDVMQGQGTYTWPGGKVYSGAFVKDKPTGKGVYSDKKDTGTGGGIQPSDNVLITWIRSKTDQPTADYFVTGTVLAVHDSSLSIRVSSGNQKEPRNGQTFTVDNRDGNYAIYRL